MLRAFSHLPRLLCQISPRPAPDTQHTFYWFMPCDVATPNIIVCRTDLIGYVELQNEPLDRWFALRVNGPHPQVALFDRSTTPNSTWRAFFRFCDAGHYTIHVRAFMAKQPWQSWELKWERVKTVAGSDHGDGSSSSSAVPCAGSWDEGVLLRRHEVPFSDANNGPSSRTCRFGLWSWVRGSASANHSVLDEIHAQPWSRDASSLAALNAGLRFQDAPPLASTARMADASAMRDPSGILPAQPQLESIQSPASNRSRVCILGDSHVRTLFDGVVRLAADGGLRACGCSKRPKNFPAPCPVNMPGSSHCTRPLCEKLGLDAAYFRVNYGHEILSPWPWPAHPPMLDSLTKRHHCNAFLFNTGQWWAANKVKPGSPNEPRTPGSYASEVEPLVAHLANWSRATGVPVGWLSTNPAPVNAGGPYFATGRASLYNMATCPPRDYRFPHVLHGYNQAAKRAAASHGLPYLDLWDIALPLHDVSVDGAHYVYGGTPVGKPQAVRSLAWLLAALAGRVRCSEALYNPASESASSVT